MALKKNSVKRGNEYFLYSHLADFYELLYKRSHSTEKGIGFECDLVEKAFKLAENGKKVCKILDVGCGTGLHAIELSKRGFEVVGFDLSRQMVSLARKKNLQEKTSARFFCASMGNLGAIKAGGCFGAAIAMHKVLMHAVPSNNFLASLKNLNEMLVEGGVLLVDFSDYASMKRKKTFPSVYVDSARIGDETVLEVSENRFDLKKNILFEHNTYYHYRDGRDFKKYQTFGKLQLVDFRFLKAALEKTGFKLAGVFDLETGKKAGADSDEFLAVAVKEKLVGRA